MLQRFIEFGINIIEAVEQAERSRAPLQRLADRGLLGLFRAGRSRIDLSLDP